MIKKQIIMAIFLLAITIRLSLADPVMFNFKNEDLNGNPLKLTSILKKPDGNGPFPAIVLLHGCGGDRRGSGSSARHTGALEG